jgi:hypothetical protein
MQVKINGIETRYVLSNEGGGPWLTFIHQLGGDLSVWDPLAGYFRGDFTVLRYDLRGHGKTAVSSEPFGIRRSVARSRRAARCARRAHHTSCRHVDGRHDRAAIRLDHPSRVDTLTVADTTGGTLPEGRALWDQRAAAARTEGMAS